MTPLVTPLLAAKRPAVFNRSCVRCLTAIVLGRVPGRGTFDFSAAFFGMLRTAIISVLVLALLGGGVVLMHKGGAADLDVPGRTTDSGKNKLGER